MIDKFDFQSFHAKRSRTSRVTVLLMILLGVLLVLPGCKTVPLDPSADTFLNKEMWTITNLRVRDGNQISWQNYLSGRILPVGTAVRFTKIDVEKAVFVDVHGNEFIFHWRGQKLPYKEIFDQEYYKYFSFESPTPQLAKLNEDQRRSINIGDIYKGMPKAVVVFSWGWPPNILDPKKTNVWRYWTSSDKENIVYFEQNVVVHVVK